MGADHLIALAVVTSPDVDDAARIRTGFGGEEDPTTSAEHTTRDVESSSSSSSGVGTPPTPPPPSISGAVSTTTTTRRHALRSFLPGLRWGFGHSLGLALVCVVFFATKRAANLDAIGDVADKLVGASMIVLGVWALYALHRWRKRRLREAAHVADDDATGVGDAGIHRPFPPVAASRPEGDGFHGFHGDGAVRRTDLDLTRGPSLLGALVLEAGSAEHAAAHDLHLPHVHLPRRHRHEQPHRDDEKGDDEKGPTCRGKEERGRRRLRDVATASGAFYTLVPIRPRWRGERRSLRIFPGVSLRPSLAFNPRPRRLSTPPRRSLV